MSTATVTRVTELRKRLEKKKSFIDAVRDLSREAKALTARSSAAESTGDDVHAGSPEVESVFDATKRAFVVCKARFSAAVYWGAFVDLVRSSLILASAVSVDRAPALRSMLVEARAHYEEMDASEERYQRDGAGAAPSHPSSSYGLDMGNAASGGPVNLDESGDPRQLESLLFTLLSEIEGIGGALAGEELLDATDDSEILKKKPPAAKGTVDSLERVRIAYSKDGGDSAKAGAAAGDARGCAHVDAESVLESAEPVVCLICHVEFKAGDIAIRLPCTHIFCAECIRFWLLQHSCTCPLCRRELPTDNPRYEKAKQREEERKGAENAVRLGELMYM